MGKATHSSILAGEIPWAEEPGGLQSLGSKRAGHDCSNLAHTHILKQINDKDLLYSEGGYTQPLMKMYNGKESEKEYIYTHTHIYK